MPPPHRRFQWWHKRGFFLSDQPSRPAAGDTYDGPLAYTTDPTIGRPGYYALSEDGKTINPDVMLTWIDDAPHDEEDGSGHFIIADSDEPYYSHRPPHLDDPNYIELEARVRGVGGVTVDGEGS